MNDNLGIGLSPGSPHYRAYVGPPEDYDLISAMCFGLLTSMGLRGHHSILDIGCGSCRLGRLLIPYLNPGKYFGLEPNQWLVEEGIANEIGNDLIQLKSPSFHFTETINDIGKPEYFDFAIAQSIFSHCGRDLLEKHLSDAFGALTPTGALLATFIVGDSAPSEHGWIYPGCVAYSASKMEEIARSHGFDFYLLDWLHPRQQWALFAKKGFDVSWLIGHPLTWNTWLRYATK